MATAHKSNPFGGIGKPVGSIALWAILAIGIVLGLIVGGGFSLYSQLNKLKIELALAKRDIETKNERLMSLQRAAIQQDQSSAAAMLARPKSRSSAMAQPTSPPHNALQITAAEAGLIREFLMRIDAFRPMVTAGYKVGDTIPDDRLLDFSVLLTEKVPKLQNINYTIDQNGSIIIVSENRIIAILDFVNVAR
jgi:predicted lipid-binding transport protein (Tim44 family)